MRLLWHRRSAPPPLRQRLLNKRCKLLLSELLLSCAARLTAAASCAAAMDHPRQGSSQMFRRDLSEQQFRSVLDDPRAHTGQGYHRK